VPVGPLGAVLLLGARPALPLTRRLALDGLGPGLRLRLEEGRERLRVGGVAVVALA
jgi:hypothetical protein